MNKIRKLIKLRYENKLSGREISRALGISRPAVKKYLTAYEVSGIEIDKLDSLPDSVLLTKLEPTKYQTSGRYQELSSQFQYFIKELKRTGVTLHLLWQEYKATHPDGYEYSQFCYHFSEYSKQNKLSMHIGHKAGDKLYVDFTGDKMQIYDIKWGETQDVEVFVAVLGASGYAYAEAVCSQKKEDWLKVNTNTLHYLGGVPNAIMPDCLKSGVTKADKYEPEINPEYEDFANHYNTVILPARSRKPKDKALVENAVKLVYMRVFAPLRNQRFHSLDDLNEAIWEKLDIHNNMRFQRLDTTRRQLFETIDLPALKELPATRYELKSIEYRTVQFNYHVYLKEDKHYYSTPHRYRGKKVKIKYTNRNVEIIYDNERIAFHKRNRFPGGYTTINDHMPSTHRFYAEWSPQRFLNWAGKQGEYVEKVVAEILASRQYPEQAYRSCLGVLSLEKKYGLPRVNKACKRAVEFKAYKYKAIKNILDKGLDKIIEIPPQTQSLPDHENIRGSRYFEKGVAGE